MLLVWAWSRSSASSRSVEGGSVDQRLPTCRISPEAASWLSRRSVLACGSPAALAILPVVYSPSGSSRSALLTRSSRLGSAPRGCGRGRVRGPDRGRLGRLADWWRGWSVSVTGSTGGAHDDRLATVRPYNRELAPAAPAAANGAAASDTVDHGEVLGIQWLHSLQDRRRPKRARYLLGHGPTGTP